ncbi:MAG TPA: hypothetical protein VFE46_17635 [Pirellulales bacterium]|jgi:hypothetical protein|nr:hypothetical protein [Pirellulales bacterium]
MAVDSAPIVSAPGVSAPQPVQLLVELEAQQDRLLRDLDDLNQQIEQAIVVGQMSVRRPAENAAAF